MKFTIKNKLIILGTLAVTALSATTFMTYRTNAVINELSNQSKERAVYSDLTAQLRIQRLTLENNYYAAVIDRAKGKVPEDNAKGANEAVAFLREKTDLLINVQLDYLDQGQLKEQRHLVDELAQIVQVDLPRLVESHAGEEEFIKSTSVLENTATKLRELHRTADAQTSKAVGDISDQASTLIHQANATLIISYGISLALLLPLLAMLIVSIIRPLKGIAADIGRLSTGDYSKTIAGTDRNDEIGDMAKALNANVSKIRDTVTRIKEAALSVNSAASEIAAGSSDLSMRTEQQASSLEETAASMEEITGTVKQNSANASSANDLAASANTNADQGGRVVEQAVSAMSNIEHSSQKISDIIGVIDEIAFQTNLLALNAAVEAARAGDAGKGFAVVASEVRSLAGRSATASKEIKTLINESAAQVQTGAELVGQAGEALKGIVGSVKQVAGIVSDIASASQQQATGIDEINSAVTQMDEVTQQNAALVEESNAAAQSMLEQAKTLEGLIAFFKVDEAAGEAASESPKASVPRLVKSAAPKAAAPASKPAAGKVAAVGQAHDGWEEF